MLGALLLGLALVLPAPILGWTVSPGDLSWVRLPFSPFYGGSLNVPELQLASDWVDVFYPDQSWMVHQLLNGHLPLWSDAIFGGWPLFASQQTSMVSPFTWFQLVSTADGTTASIVGKVAVSALGTWLLARRLEMSAAAAALSGVSFASGSYFLAWIFHPHTAAYAWMPWATWGLLALLSADRRARHVVMCAAACTLMWSAGHPQSAAISTAFCVAFATYVWRRQRRPLRSVALPAVALGAGVAGAAIQLLPLVDLLQEAYSAKRGGAVGASPLSLLSLVVPNWWETPRLAPTPLPGLSNYFERTVYIGVAPLLLAGIGVVRSRHWLRPFLLTTLVACLPLALDFGAISRFLVELPLLDRISLARTLIVVSFVLALLAGLGLDAVRERLGTWTVVSAAAFIAAVAALLLVVRPDAPADLDLHLTWPWRTATTSSEAASGALAHFLLAATLALVLLIAAWRRPRKREAILVLLVATATVDLVAHGRALLPLQASTEAQLRSTPAIARLQALQGDGRIAAGPPAVFHPNVPSLFGLRDIRGRGLPVPRRLVRAWEALQQPAAENHALFDPALPQSGRFLSFAAVRAVLVPPSVSMPGMKLDYAGPDGRVYRVAKPTGRATFVTRWQQAANEDQAVRLLGDATAEQIASHPVIETSRRDDSTSNARGRARATIELAGTNRVVVRTQSAAPGFLVLRDTYLKRWHARVSGTPTEIVPANVTHRAVWVPAGTHTVEFLYRPTSLLIGGLVSIAAWATVAGVSLAMRRRTMNRR